jgi:uncharacterized membrane protein YhiD involved in acid resistance
MFHTTAIGTHNDSGIHRIGIIIVVIVVVVILVLQRHSEGNNKLARRYFLG